MRNKWLRGSLVMGVLLISCCSGCVYFTYWISAFHVYSYDAEDSAGGDGLRILPQTRLNYPSRLVGPPYWIDITLRDLPTSAFGVSLNSMTITTDSGQTLAASIGVPVYEVRGNRSVLLYASIEEGDWGAHPVLNIEYEILEPDSRTRESLMIPLRATHTSAIGFMSAI